MRPGMTITVLTMSQEPEEGFDGTPFYKMEHLFLKGVPKGVPSQTRIK
jgi:hypothetical protein